MSTWTEEQQRQLRREIMWNKSPCVCGSGTTWQIVLEILERAASDERIGFYKPFSDASARWAEFGAHVLDMMDLLEHGTGIGWPWLSDKGKLLLGFLQEFGTDSNKWPEWAVSERVSPIERKNQ